jgi:polyvinyl alcohol dehydrogenase (cytochrome)
MGGLQWGSATDGKRIYTAASNSYFIPHIMGPGPKSGQEIVGGFWSALDAATGEVLWENAGATLAFPSLIGIPPPGAIAMNQGPVTVANGVMYAGALDQEGTMYAFNAATGNILWSFASGGSVNSGAAVVNGVVYWGSGYSSLGGTQGTHLYAFTIPSLKNASFGDNNNFSNEMQKQFVLEQNYPNPFNTSTQIRFGIPEAGKVTLKIYNSAGEQLKTLVDRNMSAGFHQVTWDATDNRGNKISSGIYFYKITAGKFTQMNKIILSK